MKTCKKILAGVLVFAMMMSMCAFVSADEATETETTATSVLVTGHSFDGLTAGTVTNSGKTIASDGGVSSSALYARGSSPANKVNTTTVVAESDGDGNYITTTHNRLGYNHRKTAANYATFGLEDYPVLSISYDIMIPDNDTYKTYRRFGKFGVGASDTDTSKYASTNSITVNVENGTVSASIDSLSSTAYSGSASYTYGEWITIQALAWVNDSNTLDVAVFADEQLIYVASGSKTSYGMATNSIDFEYYNKIDGSGQIAVESDGSTAIESHTNYDNIKIELLPATAKVTEDVINDLVASIPYVTILDAPVNSLEAIKSSYSANITDDETTGIRTIVASKAGNIVSTTGITSSSLFQGSTTKAASTYQVVTEGDRTYLSSKSTNYQYLTNTQRKSFAAYVRGDLKHTLVGSIDMYVPAGGISVERRHYYGLTLDAASDGTYRRIVNDLQFGSTVENGEINFQSSTDGQGSDVAGASRSESRTFEDGKWYTITYVMEVTHGADSYDVDVYGIFEDEVIYKNSHIITYADFNEDGITDELGFNGNYIYFTPDTAGTEFETRLDNMSFVKNNNFDWSAINTDAWVNRTVELTLDADGNVDVNASKKEDAFTSGVLVVALYDANGKVVEIIKSTEITDGKFVYEVPAAKVATASLIKGFVFDSITTAVPQFPHGALIIE